jgi:hypothetical protein
MINFLNTDTIPRNKHWNYRATKLGDRSLTRFRHPGLNNVTDLVKFNQVPMGDCANLSVIVDFK